MSRFLGEPEIRILDRAALEVLPAAPTPLHPGRIWIEAGELRIHGAVPFASTAYVDAHAALTNAHVDAHAALTNAHSAVSTATANRMVLRDAAGRAQVADGAVAADIATRGQVDARVLRSGDVMTGNLTAPDVSWGVGNSRGILLPEGANLNNLVRAGWYDVNNAVNRPPVISGWTRIMVTRGHSDFFVHQLATDLFSDGMWHRRSIESPPGTGTRVWQPWQRIWNEGNDGAGSGLDADLLDGLDSSVFARAVHVISPDRIITMSGRLAVNTTLAAGEAVDVQRIPIHVPSGRVLRLAHVRAHLVQPDALRLALAWGGNLQAWISTIHSVDTAPNIGLVDGPITQIASVRIVNSGTVALTASASNGWSLTFVLD